MECPLSAPIPKPRKRANIYVNIRPNTIRDSSKSEDNSAESRPIPLPRRIYSANPSDSSSSTSSTSSLSLEAISQREIQEDSDFFAQFGPKKTDLDHNKRGTINLFRRKVENPFDNDFEVSLKDATTLTTDLCNREDSNPGFSSKNHNSEPPCTDSASEVMESGTGCAKSEKTRASDTYEAISGFHGGSSVRAPADASKRVTFPNGNSAELAPPVPLRHFAKEVDLNADFESCNSSEDDLSLTSKYSDARNSSVASSTRDYSLVMEFDPLFSTEGGSRSISDPDQGQGQDAKLPNDANVAPNRYEHLDTSSDDEKPCKIPEKSMQSPGFEPRVKLGANNAVNNNLYYPVELRPRRKAELPPPEKLENDPAEVSSNSSSDSNSKDGASGVAGRNFFRRLSNKIRPKKELLAIREDYSVCGTCGSEHVFGRTKCHLALVPKEVVYATFLYRPSGGIKKDWVKRRVVLKNGKISFLNDKSMANEEYPLERVGMVSKSEDVEGKVFKFFTLRMVGGKGVTLGGETEEERESWMGKYIECFTNVFPHSVAGSYEMAGWCFIKERVTSDWFPSWLILKDRILYYSFMESNEFFQMDLRKVRSIQISTKDPEYKSHFVDNSDVLTIDMISKILYVQTDDTKLTSIWCEVLKNVSFYNGPKFEEKQLTGDNVPVLVEKCIDFLYAHGTLAEGIYRQSGSNARTTTLLQEFQNDAWGVVISHKEYTAHDVAGTLKRFFRTLPEPLVTDRLYKEWIKTCSIRDFGSKMAEYRRLLEELPEINFNIMKKLICHLYAVHELHEKNLMPLLNLAPIWGPTLMSVDSSKKPHSYEQACGEREVIKDLIENYYALFRVEAKEIEREKNLQDALENFHLGSIKRKCSGDIKMFIYVGERDDSTAVNITLTPLSTAKTIVSQLAHLPLVQRIDPEKLSLHEIVLTNNGLGTGLERPLHPSEKVIEIVLRWSVWELEERKDNYLILKENTFYPQILHFTQNPEPTAGDWKYADSKSKGFRKCHFALKDSRIKYSRDAKASELGSWAVDDLVWYLGVEAKRNPPSSWALTFVKRNYIFKRCKDEPYFGSVISFESNEDLLKWMGQIMICEHPEGIYPAVFV